MGQNIRRDARAEIDELDFYGCFVPVIGTDNYFVVRREASMALTIMDTSIC